MKYSLEAAVREVSGRCERVRNDRLNRRIRGLACASVVLSMLAAAGIARFANGRQTAMRMACLGASVMSADAGGYILVGLLCFVAAVVVTLLCVKRRDKRG